MRFEQPTKWVMKYIRSIMKLVGQRNVLNTTTEAIEEGYYHVNKIKPYGYQNHDKDQQETKDTFTTKYFMTSSETKSCVNGMSNISSKNMTAPALVPTMASQEGANEATHSINDKTVSTTDYCDSA